MPPEQALKVREDIRQSALETNGDEPGAKEYRFKAITIDKSKGSKARLCWSGMNYAECQMMLLGFARSSHQCG